jgi:predicted nucleic acid-binding protein
LRKAREVQFIVPAIWPVEMVNVLLVNERRKRLTTADTTRVVRLVRELEIQVARAGSLEPFAGTLLLGRVHGLSSDDASYLELAMRTGAPLATLDAKLRSAAQAAGVGLFA